MEGRFEAGGEAERDSSLGRATGLPREREPEPLPRARGRAGRVVCVGEEEVGEAAVAVVAVAATAAGSISFSFPFASPSIVVGLCSPSPCCACFFAITTGSSDFKLAFLLSAAVNVVNNLEPVPVQLVLLSGLVLADTRRDAGLLSSESSNALVRFGGGERWVVLLRVVAAAGAVGSGLV